MATWREKYDQSSLDKYAPCITHGRGRRARRDGLLPMASIRGGKEIPEGVPGLFPCAPHPGPGHQKTIHVESNGRCWPKLSIVAG